MDLGLMDGASTDRGQLSNDIEITARTIFGEARGERGTLPLVAVAWVIRNRAAARVGDGAGKPMWWGGTPAEVCLKAVQFSCWNPDDPNLPVIQAATLDQPRFAECFGIAALVLAGDSFPDPTKGATHYYALGIPAPSWASVLMETAIIGTQRFMK